MTDHHIRRIAVFGAPCSGRVAFAKQLYDGLKRRSYNVDLAVYNRPVVRDNEPHLTPEQRFAIQLQTELSMLDNNRNFIVTAKPVLLAAFYAGYNHLSCAADQLSQAKAFEQEFFSYNVLISPNVAKFHSEARCYPHGEPKRIHDSLAVFLRRHIGKDLRTVDPDKWVPACHVIDEILKTYGYKTGCR